MVEQELPVVPDMSIAHNAQILLDACLAVGLVEWSIALALALENTLVLSGAIPGGPGTLSSGTPIHGPQVCELVFVQAACDLWNIVDD